MFKTDFDYYKVGIPLKYRKRKIIDKQLMDLIACEENNNLVIDTSNDDNEFYSVVRAYVLRFQTDNQIRVISLSKLIDDIKENDEPYLKVLAVPDFSMGIMEKNMGDIVLQSKLQNYFISRLRNEKLVTILNTIDNKFDSYWNEKFINILKSETV